MYSCVRPSRGTSFVAGCCRTSQSVRPVFQTVLSLIALRLSGTRRADIGMIDNVMQMFSWIPFAFGNVTPRKEIYIYICKVHTCIIYHHYVYIYIYMKSSVEFNPPSKNWILVWQTAVEGRW